METTLPGPAYCITCGERLKPETAFCTACGHPVPESGVSTANSGPPVRTGAAPARSGAPEPTTVPAAPIARRRPSGLAIGGVVVLVLALAAAGVGLLVRRSSTQSPTKTTAAGAPTSLSQPSYSSFPTPTSAMDDLRIQATAVDGLLAQSVARRSAVSIAAAQIQSCTSLSAAEATMISAANTRESIGSSAARLSVSALPNGSSLINLLQQMMSASATADRYYAAWAPDVANCSGNAAHTANFSAAEAASSQATALKRQFAAIWNPVASSAGLSPRNEDQL